MSSSYNKLFLLFGGWLKGQKYSRNTKETYLQVCKKFLLYLDDFDIRTIKNADRGSLLKFLTKRGDKLYAQNYTNMRQSALNVFYAWAHSNKYCQSNPMLNYRKAKIKTKTYPEKATENPSELTILNPEEQRALLNTATNDSFTTIRNKCIVSIILATALYAEETINLRIDDLDLENGYIDIGNKTNKKRRVPTGIRSCNLACRDWLEARTNVLGKRKSNLLFFTDEFRPITKRTLHRIVSKSMLDAGIDKARLGPEVLRQTAIFNMLSSGKTIEEVQAITGIKTLKNIQKYQRANLDL